VNTWTCALSLVWKGALFEDLAGMISKATGIHFTAKMIREVSDRVGVVERAFNIRQGITIKDYMLP
jgi:aldehyde:ferredoxin oxidoreductase